MIFPHAPVLYQPKFGGRQPGVLLERGVEGGLGIEPDLFGDGEDGVVPKRRVGQLPARLGDAVRVDEVGEGLAQPLVDELREVLRREREPRGEFLQREAAVGVRLLGLHYLNEPLQILLGPLGCERRAFVLARRGRRFVPPGQNFRPAQAQIRDRVNQRRAAQRQQQVCLRAPVAEHVAQHPAREDDRERSHQHPDLKPHGLLRRRRLPADSPRVAARRPDREEQVNRALRVSERVPDVVPPLIIGRSEARKFFSRARGVVRREVKRAEGEGEEVRPVAPREFAARRQFAHVKVKERRDKKEERVMGAAEVRVSKDVAGREEHRPADEGGDGCDEGREQSVRRRVAAPEREERGGEQQPLRDAEQVENGQHLRRVPHSVSGCGRAATEAARPRLPALSPTPAPAARSSSARRPTRAPRTAARRRRRSSARRAPPRPSGSARATCRSSSRARRGCRPPTPRT
jgi:hypothetical protein